MSARRPARGVARGPARGLLLAIAWHAALLAGCERVTHDMADQPRGRFSGASTFFADGQSGRPPPDHAVPYAMGDRAAVSSGREGRVAASAAASSLKAGDPSDAVLARGHARYAIFCAACHGATGAADGEVVRRGFPRPLPFAQAGADATSDDAVRATILQGRGVMPAFADRIDVRDADAIAAWVRTLASARGGAGAGPGPGAARAEVPPP